MIYYNLNTINGWNFGDDNIIKVYKHGAVCYYKITSGDTPTPVQEPCFAVVDNITQYSETEFEDVYDKATEKWYKLNNLNQYEEYGIYGSGRTSCESSSRLPQGYTEVEYVENTSTAYIDTGAYLNTSNFEVGYTFWGNRAQWGYVHQNVANGAWITTANDYAYMGRFDSSYRVAIGSYFTSDENTIVYTQSGVTVNGTSISKNLNLSGTDNLNASTLLFFAWYDFYRAGVEHSFNSKVKSFYLKNNGTLVRDFVPAKRDSDNKYGMYDLITDTFYFSPNNVDFSGGEPITPTDCVTTYNGKLTIDDGYEYMYSGGSWVNVGEVSGSSITIKSPEYVGNTSSSNGTINLGIVLKDNTRFQVKLKPTKAGGGAIFGETNAPSDSDDYRFFWASSRMYYDYGNSRLYTSKSINTIYEYEIGNYYIKDLTTSTNVLTGATKSGTATSHIRNIVLFMTTADITSVYYMKIYEGDTLVRDFIPWTDLNGNYGMFDKVSMQTFLPTASLSGSSNVTDVEVGGGYEYPLEYTVKQDPPNNVTFTSMTEAESYECPWVGMKATIDGSGYTFSGDAISGYEWVYNSSRLPVGYTEVEYIENIGTSYLNTNFVPNQDTRVLCDMQNVTASNFPRLWGAGAWNSATGLMIDYDPNQFQVSWFGKTTWTNYSAYPTSTSYNRHTYDLNKNYVYIDEALVGSNTYATRTASDPIGVFTYIGSGRPSSSSYWGQEHFKGKMYSFKVYDNGTLVRDLVPCKRDNDNTVGAYDIVNDVFYTVPTGYTTDKLIAGDPV